MYKSTNKLMYNFKHCINEIITLGLVSVMGPELHDNQGFF